MKSRPCSTFACFVLLVSLSACATKSVRSTRGTEHIVIVWLKRPGNEHDKAQLIAASKEMQRRLPVIRGLSYGRPLPGDRALVDNTFDLAFVMSFSDSKDLAAYQSSAVHQRAAKEILAPLSRKILIYDIECR